MQGGHTSLLACEVKRQRAVSHDAVFRWEEPSMVRGFHFFFRFSEFQEASLRLIEVKNDMSSFITISVLFTICFVPKTFNVIFLIYVICMYAVHICELVYSYIEWFIWSLCDFHLLHVLNTVSRPICLTSVMHFYMPLAKGKTPHVWVINFSKVYWRNRAIK